MNMDIIPMCLNKSILNDLKNNIKKAKAIRGVVAFWTVTKDFLGKEMQNILQNSDSFFCVDFHFPTDLDNIYTFFDNNSKQCNFYLFLRRCANNKDINLLHSKMILFDFENGEAELWIGSHNFTKTALNGRNIEHTIKIPLRVEDEMYKNAQKTLINIKYQCTLLTIGKKEYFQTLQDIHNYRNLVKKINKLNDLLEKRRIFLVGIDIGNIHINETLLLLGKDKLKVSQITLKETMILHILDISTLQEIAFEIEIINVGVIDLNNEKSYNIVFSPRFCAIRLERTRPFLFDYPKKQIGKDQLKHYDFFMNIRIIRHVETIIKQVTQEDIWEEEMPFQIDIDDLCKQPLRAKNVEDIEKIAKSNLSLKVEIIHKVRKKQKQEQEKGVSMFNFDNDKLSDEGLFDVYKDVIERFKWVDFPYTIYYFDEIERKLLEENELTDLCLIPKDELEKNKYFL